MNRREALAALVAMPEIARVERATLKPADVIVVTVKGRITQDMAVCLRQELQGIWPDNKIAIVDDHIELKVVSPSA